LAREVREEKDTDGRPVVVMSVALVAVGGYRLDEMEDSTFGQWRKFWIGLTGSPYVLSANIVILAAETKGEEIEVHVEGETR
jgi:hypothetical protein